MGFRELSKEIPVVKYSKKCDSCNNQTPYKTDRCVDCDDFDGCQYAEECEEYGPGFDFCNSYTPKYRYEKCEDCEKYDKCVHAQMYEQYCCETACHDY